MHKTTLLIVFALVGCGSPAPVYQDGQVTIVAPVRVVERQGIEDGGTEFIRLRDGAGVVHELYVSRRLGHEDEWGRIFAGAYMTEPGVFELEDQAAIRTILAELPAVE